MGLEGCTSCNVVVHCLLTRIVGWNNTKLSSVEVFGNGTLMVALGAVDAFWVQAPLFMLQVYQRSSYFKLCTI